MWVLTNKDRNSRLEIPCSMPIAYGLKDYRLPAAALRDATDKILEVCHQKGFHIRSLSTDGQWIELMTRDSEPVKTVTSECVPTTKGCVVGSEKNVKIGINCSNK